VKRTLDESPTTWAMRRLRIWSVMANREAEPINYMGSSAGVEEGR
jgi:hypothetical protein